MDAKYFLVRISVRYIFPDVCIMIVIFVIFNDKLAPCHSQNMQKKLKTGVDWVTIALNLKNL